MRIEKVLCDICNQDTGYGNDWKIPPREIIDGHDKCYEYIAKSGYRDFCKECFNEISIELLSALEHIIVRSLSFKLNKTQYPLDNWINKNG